MARYAAAILADGTLCCSYIGRWHAMLQVEHLADDAGTTAGRHVDIFAAGALNVVRACRTGDAHGLEHARGVIETAPVAGG